MNPETNKFEMLHPDLFGKILRPNGEPVPQHWTQFRDGEQVEVKGYIFEVKCIGETYMVLEPVGPIVIGKDQETPSK